MSPARSDANHSAMYLNLSTCDPRAVGVLLAMRVYLGRGYLAQARAMCLHCGMEKELKRSIACVDNMRF